jgi:hypothetical protein
MDKQEQQSIIAPTAIAATGLAAATAAFITSSFGVAGTLIGAVLTPVIVSTASAIYKAYIESASSKIKNIPVAIRPSAGSVPEADSPPGRPDLRNNFAGRFRAAFGWFSSLAPRRRRSILIGALVSAVASLLLAMATVTGVELGVGKSLSCWVWNNCPAESSRDGGRSSSTSTLPSIFGGGQSSRTPEVEPVDPQQRPVPGAPESPSQPSGPSSEDQQQSPSADPEDRRLSPLDDPENRRGSPSGDPEDRQSPSGGSGNQWQSPSGSSGEQ